jgi:hypothetical protein
MASFEQVIFCKWWMLFLLLCYLLRPLSLVLSGFALSNKDLDGLDYFLGKKLDR